MFAKRVVEVPIDLIVPGESQPRTIFRDEELLELAESIREYGVIQPVILKKDKQGIYSLIAGERRTRAAAMAGLTKVPAIVRDETEKNAAIIALVENVQRENLSYIEEATAYRKLMDEHGLTQQEIARYIGKKQSTVSNKIRLLSLPEDIREKLSENRLTERHARALLKVHDTEMRKRILERIITNDLNVRQSERLIEDFLRKAEEEKHKSTKKCYISYKVYLNSIRRAFGEISRFEKNARIYQEDLGDAIEVKILIPKKAGIS